jgi:AraC family transcriptional regulator, regulatory protein of adaptative response / DNA-3-methyladenine glycosylase II
MKLDIETCYDALKARDARFDGRFFVGVSSTGIYCRPVCPARTPQKANVDFFAHAAAAERAGFRPCLRCRPELAPGQAPMDAPDRMAQLAAAQIEAGALDEGDAEMLAARLGLSSRQLRRIVEARFGVTPVELAQTRRLLLAKQLLTDTSLPMAVVAQAAGFGSVRRFNHLFAARYAMAPSRLRLRREEQGVGESFTLRLSYRAPLAWPHLLHFLTGRGAVGVEVADGQRYLRTVSVATHQGWLAVAPMRGVKALQVQLSASLLPVLAQVLARLRRTLDLDANTQMIDAHLASDERLAPLVAALPGLRVPGAFDGFELALRAILGQQVTVKAATTLFGRFARTFGVPIHTPFEALTHLAPRADVVAQASRQQLIDLGLTTRRAETVQRMAEAVASRAVLLEPGPDPEAMMQALQELPGIGPWTAHYIAMRALRHPDAWPDGDLGLLNALQVKSHRELRARAEPWRPWRSYAALHLWNAAAQGG